jgi:putative hemolysin
MTGVHYAMVADEYIFKESYIKSIFWRPWLANVSIFYREELELVKRDDGTWLVDGHYLLHDF